MHAMLGLGLQGFQRYMEAWSKRKRVFKDIWCVQPHLLSFRIRFASIAIPLNLRMQRHELLQLLSVDAEHC